MGTDTAVLLSFTVIATIIAIDVVIFHFRYRRSNSPGSKESFLEDQIRVSKRELETVFDAISELICIIDNEFRIVRVNKSYAAFVKKPIRDVLGKPCYKVFWNRQDICEECPSKKTFCCAEPVTRKRITWKREDEIRYFESTSYPVFGKSGNVIHVIEFIRDITDEKRVFDQLVRSEKLASIGTMTAGIAHEMNNPLSGISGTAANLLKMPEKYGINEKGISRIGTILDSASRAITIMNDLLHLSRKHDHTSIMVNINSLIVKTLNAIHIRGASKISRQYSLESTIPPVSCDPSKIEQVIINIGTNAIQSVQEKKERYHQEGREFNGLLLIATQMLDDENVLITITDNGLGIPENIRSKVFDPFFSTRPAGQGTGLGLSISFKIIEEHGGRIFFECIDEMTIFSIVLPIERRTYYE